MFGDKAFRWTVVGFIVLASISAFWLLANTGLTPVRMAIVMPAINGLIGLPVTVFALIGAVNRYYDITLKENIGFALAALVLLAGSVLTAESLTSTLAGWL